MVEELADGLEETYQRHLSLGLAPGEAETAAVAEFGDPGLIAAEFARAHPARRAGTAGCAGTAALDAFMIIGVLAAEPAASWAVIVAMIASAARLGLTVRLLRPALAGSG